MHDRAGLYKWRTVFKELGSDTIKRKHAPVIVFEEMNRKVVFVILRLMLFIEAIQQLLKNLLVMQCLLAHLGKWPTLSGNLKLYPRIWCSPYPKVPDTGRRRWKTESSESYDDIFNAGVDRGRFFLRNPFDLAGRTFPTRWCSVEWHCESLATGGRL